MTWEDLHVKVWVVWEYDDDIETDTLVDICATEAAAKRVAAERYGRSIEEWDVTE